MASTLYSNFLAGTITDAPLTDSATSINSSAFANLPVVTGGDIMYLVLDPDADDGAPELVTVTAHSSSATVVTVTRAAQSTVAREHLATTVWRAVATKADLDLFRAFLQAGAVAAANLATDAVETAKIKDANVTAGKLANNAVRYNHFTPSVFVRGSTQSVAVDATDVISWTTETADTDGWATVPATNLVAPATGFYLISVRFNHDGTSSVNGFIKIDGTTVATVGANGTGILWVSTTVQLTAGAVVTIPFFNSSAGTRLVTGSVCLLRLF